MGPDTSSPRGVVAAVGEWMYNGATLYRQTGMHAAARRQPDLEVPTADGMYVIALNQTFVDRGPGRARRERVI